MNEPGPFYVSGRFAGLSSADVWARLLATGAHGVTSKSVARAYLAADPGDPKLVATGKPVLGLADLPPGLDGFLDRLKGAVAHQREELGRFKGRPFVAWLGAGPPADAALIARIEAELGPLPEDLLALMRQFNGLSCVVATLRRGHPLPEGALPEGALPGEALPEGEPLPYPGLADPAHPLWQGAVDWLLGNLAIPRWEDIFLRPRAQRLCDHGDAWGPKDVLKIGSLKVRARDLFPRLFAFDLYHPHGGAALYVGPDGQAQIVYAFDHWADLTSAHPVSLRTYMDSLAAGIWRRVSHAGQRPIRPTSRTAWPTYIRNIHGAPYVFIELK